MTTAKYYTPSHKVIHEQGITPDVPVTMTYEQEVALQMKRLPGGLESLKEKDRALAENAHDIQLDRAMDLLKGIMIITSRENGSHKLASKPEKVAAK